MKKYIQTKKECQSIIDSRNPVVCSGCGSKLEPIETVDNSSNPTYWVGCNTCSQFENGTILKHYKAARNMVIKDNFVRYIHMEKPDKKVNLEGYNYWLSSQTRGAVGVIEQVLARLKE